MVKKYYAVDQAIATDRRVPLRTYYDVADGDYVQVLLQNAQSRRAKGYRVIGVVQFGPSAVKSLVSGEPTGKLASSKVETCLDVHRVKVLDKEGKSVVRKDRARAYREVLTLEKGSLGWRVVDGQDTDTSTCAR